MSRAKHSYSDEDNKSNLDFDDTDLPFKMNSLVVVQVDALKNAIEWLATQIKFLNKKVANMPT